MPIPPLAIAMVEPSFGALLVPAVGATSLTEPREPATGGAAIVLAAITAYAQDERDAAFAVPANPWSQNYFARRRHAQLPQLPAALDNGFSSVAG